MVKLRNNWIFFRVALFTLIVAGSFYGCGKEEKEQAKSMEQIQNEEGIPVKTEAVATRSFTKYLSYYSRLSGIVESTKISMVGDKVKKLRFKLGDAVKEGQVVMEFPTDNPRLQFDQAKIALENSEKTYTRMKELLKAGETAQQTYDNVEAQYLVNKRNYESLRQMLWVEAPVSGNIVQLFVREGEDIGPDKPLFTVAQIHRLKAKFWVSESEIRYIKMGAPVILISGGKEYSARISEIGLSMDAMTRAFAVEAQLDNGKRELKSGMTVDVKIKTYENPSTIVIQRSMIQKDNEKQFVWVDAGGKAARKYIQTGEESGIEVEVLNGLAVGDNIITEGTNALEEGKKIKLIKN